MFGCWIWKSKNRWGRWHCLDKCEVRLCSLTPLLPVPCAPIVFGASPCAPVSPVSPPHSGIIANIKDMQQLHETTVDLVNRTCTEAGLEELSQHGGRRETLQSNSGAMFLKKSSVGYEPGAEAFDPRSFLRVAAGASQ